MSETRTFPTQALLDALDANPLPEQVSMLMSIEELEFDAELLDAIRANWQDAPEQASIHQLFPRYDDFEKERFGMPHYMWGKAMMVTWWLLCEWLPEFSPEDQTIGAVDGLDKHIVVFGDLTITGDFGLDSFVFYQKTTGDNWTPHLIVLGDLIVEGDFSHDGGLLFVGGDMHIHGRYLESSDWSLLAVRGDMRAAEHIDSRGELFVGGRLMSPMIELTYNHASSIVVGDTAAVVFIVSDHGRSWCGGEIHAPLADVELLVGTDGDWANLPRLSLEVLRESLEPTFSAELLEGGYEEDGVIFDADEMEVFLPDFATDLRFEHGREQGVRALFSQKALAVFDNHYNS